MLKKILPKQENFFEFFQQAAQHLVSASESFVKMTQDLAHANNYANAIAEREIAADNCARASFDLLHKRFITPFDRHDIHQLIRKLDDILDLVNRTAQRILIYQVDALPADIQQIAKLGLDAVISAREALRQLEDLKNADEIIRLCRIMSDSDSQAETIMLAGVRKLFTQDLEFKNFLIIKEIYEYSTRIVGECHDLADIIKGIVLEYS